MEGTGPSLSDIEVELNKITDYHQLGLHLGIKKDDLKKIEENYSKNERRKSEVISHWQDNSDDCSWEALAKALEKMGGQAKLVKRLRALGNQEGNDTSTSQISEQDVEAASNDTASTFIPAHFQLNLSDRLSDRPTIRELKDHVQKKIGDKWEELAIELDLDDSEDGDTRSKLDDIREKRKDNPKMAAYDVLNSWLKDKRSKPTWGKLIKALGDADLQEVEKSVTSYLSESCQNSPTSSGTTQASQQCTKQMPIKQNTETMDVSTSQDSALSLSSSQSSYHLDSTKKHYEICLEPREYQKELARPGISGQNYIICAPTNSGKTVVADMIIANHLEEKSQMFQGKPKIVFVVKTRNLAVQQTQHFSKYIRNVRVECRTGNRGEERPLQLHIRDVLHDGDTDIIVCTAGKLLDELKKEEISLQHFSLMIVDECHNTEYSKEYSNNTFAQIMRKYLELKETVEKDQLPQVVGLTATPGVGKNPGLNPAIAVDNLIMLCAHMDATGGIQTVQEHRKELNMYVQNPESHLDTVDQNERKECQRIEKEMVECEQFLGFSSQFPRYSQQYEQVVKQKRDVLDASNDENDRDKVSVVWLLVHYSQTLIKYMELPRAQAADHLDTYEDLNESNKLSEHENHLRKRFERLKADIKSLDVSENPILKKLELRLTDAFQQKRESSGIVFVRTREQAEAICKWISDSQFAENVGIKAQMLVGHGGMSDDDQKWILAEFREGRCNLLVATSVAEEGLDIKRCNLIIRLHISGARSKAQMKGRARAANSNVITIMAHDTKKLFKDIINDELILLTNYLIEMNHLPSPQQLQEEITRKQKVIMENAKRQKMLEKSRKEQHPAQDVEVKCKRCKITACRGSDIYWIDKSVNNDHVVPGEDFSALYDQVDHHKPGYLQGCTDPIVKKNYKIHCAKCNQSWGIMGTWPSGVSFPVLKCESFNFTINGKPNNFKQWKNCPFKVLPLSEWLSQSSLPVTTDHE